MKIFIMNNIKKILFLLILCACFVPSQAQVLDGIAEKTILSERRLLPYTPIREADIFWEKRVWRVIDAREKMNLPFMYPEAPFFQVLTDAISSGEIQAYRTDDDKFTYQLDNVDELLSKVDTTAVLDPETGEITYVPYFDHINYENIQRFRIKEVWFFDENTSRMRVRILGIAPMENVYDENGNFRYEKPMFWVHYPSAREALSKQKVFIDGNDATTMSWADLFELRYFASYIYKESNVLDARLEDIYTGVDMLLEGEKIKQEIFNFEHDLWSY